MAQPEIYISTDIETDGPAPGLNSMLSFGSAAYTHDKILLGTFEANLETLPEATPNPITTQWWKQFPEAWDACRQNVQKPEEALPAYVAWVKSLPGKPQFVGLPAGFDFSFMYYYMMRFAGESPFHCAAIDIKSFAMAMLQTEYRKSGRSFLPEEWFDKALPHTHIALDDAIEQGALFCNMLSINREQT